MIKEIQTALHYMKTNRFDEAKRLFKEVCENSPDTIFFYRMLLVCMLNSSTPNQELEQYVLLILGKFPQDALAHFAMGKVFSNRLEKKKAIEHFKIALSMEPENVDFLCGLSLALWNAKQLKDASNILDQAIAIDPENITALTYKSYFLGESFNLNLAKENIGKALKYDPMNWMLFAQSGSFDLANMDYKVAQNNFKESIRLNPQNPDIKDDYLNSLLAENFVFRILFSKYWIFNKYNFAVRPIFCMNLVILATFYKIKHPSVNVSFTLVYWLIIFSFVVQCLVWIVAPAYRFFKSRQLWGTYYRKFWTHQIFVQTSVQLALLAILYFWVTEEFRGVTSAFFLTFYGFLVSIIFLNEYKKIQQLYIGVFAFIYSCATINLILDFWGITITPIEVVGATGWLFFVLLDGVIDWALEKWPKLKQNL